MRIGVPSVLALTLPVVLAMASTGCRGDRSTKPPIHLERNMMTQQKYKPQSESRWFEDGATMRTPVEHTVAQDDPTAGDPFFTGKAGDAFVDSPVRFSDSVLSRGRERFGIYCRPCHGELGNGRGPILRYKYPIPPTSYFDPRVLAMKDGNIFAVISDGIRNMPSYRRQIPARDRWAIVGHVRVLQRQHIPDSLKGVPQQSQATAP